MTNLIFAADFLALIASCFVLYYIGKIERLTKSFTFRFLKMATAYAILLRFLIMMTYYDGLVEVVDVSGLMSLYWIFLAAAFYEMYSDLNKFIQNKMKGGLRKL